ncbi:uncharacterized protein BXZ73DRAFT_47430 [Epithele typhae]|uniref:uncharacterized protein n=1 Tax=Epithele typhae TaxID=378194 RepID=UPI0020072DA5|nr:uncharacterized protein BXZ73DRAFT_47430 [Epithele typhae]KAH9931137.1 hypothetical protein BXZ73DRAFT_47430 [Epithele typhae]
MNTELNATWADNLKRRLGLQLSVSLTVWRASPLLIMKTSDCSEIAAMKFARQNTNIPIPRIHESDSRDWLFMDFIDGETLWECWDRLSFFRRFRVACTLRLFIKQLRALAPPAALIVGSLDSGHAKGIVFGETEYAPFRSMDHFRRFCNVAAFLGWEHTPGTNAIRLEVGPPPRPTMDWTPVFSHADLNRSNIILDRQGTLWIIDWAMAGFYPRCIEPIVMQDMEDPVMFPQLANSSWPSFIPFIAGRVTDEEKAYWRYVTTGIDHRRPGVTV